MTSGYLDTNILIGFFKGDPAVRRALERFDSLRIPALAYAEFMVGLPYESQRAAVDEAIDALFDIVHTDRALCQQAAVLRRTMRLKIPDAMIYATARAGGGVLITADRDFTRGLTGTTKDIYVPE